MIRSVQHDVMCYECTDSAGEWVSYQISKLLNTCNGHHHVSHISYMRWGHKRLVAVHWATCMDSTAKQAESRQRGRRDADGKSRWPTNPPTPVGPCVRVCVRVCVCASPSPSCLYNQAHSSRRPIGAIHLLHTHRRGLKRHAYANVLLS